MKRILLLLALTTGSGIIATNAQVHVDINIGTQPVWGPVGYDYAEYYYLPDIDAYYNVPRRLFIYPQGSGWVFSASLPYAYRNYDLYHGYKVVVNEPRPYMHHERYVTRYAPYRGNREQPYIRESHEEKYWQIKDHPEHGKWNNGNNGHGNGNGNGNGHGNGNGNGNGHGNKGGHRD